MGERRVLRLQCIRERSSGSADRGGDVVKPEAGKRSNMEMPAEHLLRPVRVEQFVPVGRDDHAGVPDALPGRFGQGCGDKAFCRPVARDLRAEPFQRRVVAGRCGKESPVDISRRAMPHSCWRPSGETAIR